MKSYYALIVRGSSSVSSDGLNHRFFGQNDFVDTEAENIVQAFLKIYSELSKEGVEITALKTDFQERMLGFTEEEFDEISKTDIRIREGYPTKTGIQIQAIRDVPFK